MNIIIDEIFERINLDTSLRKTHPYLYWDLSKCEIKV